MNADEWKVKNCQFWRDLYVEFDMIKNEEQRVAATTTIYIEACREQMNPRASDPSSPEGFVPADKLNKAEEKKPIPPSETKPSLPDNKQCPKCHGTVPKAQSQRTGAHFYLCKNCDHFINADGSVVPCKH